MLAMGWDGVHLYLFRIGDTDYGDGFEDAPEIVDDRKVRLRTVSGDGDTFAFIYDMGDSWEHDVTVEVVQPAGGAPLPRILDGANRCPPEDIGGPPGYQEFLDALRDVTHPDHESTLDWWLSVATPDDPVFLADEFDVAGKDREIGAVFRGEPTDLSTGPWAVTVEISERCAFVSGIDTSKRNVETACR